LICETVPRGGITGSRDNLVTASRKSPGLADPTRLGASDKHDLTVVIIEKPKGSRNKYAYDPEERIFELTRVLPAGMEFPYDFGFVPSTIGGDGDPIDVLVLMDEPAFPGCVLLVRLLGVMKAEQTEHGKTNRNDRLIAVAETSQLFANFKTV